MLTITTDNDYTGGTNVEGGTLIITGTLESDVRVSQGAGLQLSGGHEVSVTAASGSETATLTGVSWSNGTLSGSDAETRGMLSGAHLHLAKDAVVTLENLELDATMRITDDPTTLLLKDVVSQQEEGGSLSEVGQDLLYVGTVLKENGSGTLLEPEEQATVTELVSSTCPPLRFRFWPWPLSSPVGEDGSEASEQGESSDDTSELSLGAPRALSRKIASDLA